MASSTIVHIPPSFPPETPSSPPARLSDIEESDADYKLSLDGDFMDEDQDDSIEGDSQSNPESGDDNEEDWSMVQEVDMSYEDSARQTLTLLADRSCPQGNPLSMLPFTFVPIIMSYGPYLSLSQSASHSEAPSHPLCDIMTPPLDAPAISMWSHSHSTSASSAIARAAAVLSWMPDWQKSFPELLSEINNLQDQVQQKDTKLLAANTHCTIIQQGMADANKQIESLTKKKTCTSTKVKACFGTLSELKAAFQEEAQRLEQEQLNAEKEAQKTAEVMAQNACIATDAVLWMFDNSLSTYKHKDDLLTIAGTLQIMTTGTVPQLTVCIKEHLHTHPDLASNPRFSGLFRQGDSGQWHANILGLSEFQSIPAASLLPTPSSHVSINESTTIISQFLPI